MSEVDNILNITDSSSETNKAWRSALVATNAVVIPTVGVFGFVFNSLGIATLFHMGINSSSMVFMLILFVGDIWSGFVDSILTAGLVEISLCFFRNLFSELLALVKNFVTILEIDVLF